MYLHSIFLPNNSSNQCGRRANQKLGFFILTIVEIWKQLNHHQTPYYTKYGSISLCLPSAHEFFNSLILSSSWLLTECCQAPKLSWTAASASQPDPVTPRRSHPHRSLNPRQCVIMDPIPSFPGSSFHPSLETLKLLRNKIIIFVIIL